MKTSEAPETLRPYLYHGIDLTITGANAVGECFLCGRKKKLNVRVDNGFWRCVVCSEGDKGGNASTFIKMLYEQSLATTKDDFYDLIEQRHPGLQLEWLLEIGMCKHLISDEIIVPGFNDIGNVTTIYRILWDREKEKWRAMATPVLGHGLFCLVDSFFQKDIRVIDVLEGYKDAVAWKQALNELGITDRNVCGVGGTNGFKPSWCWLFQGAIVNIMLDNDHPKLNKKTGTLSEPAGVAGIKRMASILKHSPTPPKQINYIAWNGNKDGWSSELTSGLDVKDFVSA